MPVRKIPKNYRSVTGWLASLKTGRSVAYESTLERDLFCLCEFDLRVRSFEEQPVRIEYRDESGRTRTYTPDALVHFHPRKRGKQARRPLLLEVKYADEIASTWPELHSKVLAGRAYARERGWRFRLVSDRLLRTSYVRNAVFLLRFRSYPSDHAREILLQDRLRQLGLADAETLLAACYWHPLNRDELLPSLWKLVSEQKVGCDLTEPLTMTSPLWTLASPVVYP